MAKRFANQVVLITGGGSGIGRALALAYAREEAMLVIAGRRLTLLQSASDEIRCLGAECLPVRTDVTREDDCSALVSQALERFGRIDALINNAGSPGVDMPVARMTIENWNQTIATNLTGPMLLTRAALQQAMIPAERGNIQFVSSAAAKHVRPQKADYAVAKMGLVTLAQTLALEVSRYNIRVNCLLVGLVAGELIDRWVDRMAQNSGRSTDTVRANLLADIPLKRPVAPGEVADLSMYLSSDSASAITGQSISVSNGYLMA